MIFIAVKKIIGYCVRDGIDHGSTDQTIAEFTKKYSLSAPLHQIFYTTGPEYS